MGNIDRSDTYAGIGTEGTSSDSVPIPAAGIGTRYREAADAIGSREKAARMSGVSPDMLQKYFREASSPSFDVAARLCFAAGKTLHWLATGADQSVTSQSQDMRLDLVTLRDAVEVVDAALELADREITLADRAELYGLVYGWLGTDVSVPKATTRILKLIMGGKR